MTGFLVVLAVGLVVLAVAALRDRRSRLAAEAASPLAHRRRLPVPDAATRRMLDDFRTVHERLDAPLADPLMANLADPPTAALTDAEVLCCLEAPQGLRELLGSRAAARRALRPLLVVCPALDDVTLAEVGAASGDASLVVLCARPEVVEQVAVLVTAHPVRRADLQSGAAAHAHGRAAHVLADADGAWFEPVEA